MKYVFFGTPEFARIVLSQLIDGGHIPEAVVTNPDRPVGRKQVMTPPPVKQFLADSAVRTTLLQPERVSEIHAQLISFRPDLFIVAAFSKMLPKEILAVPRLGSVGVHPSLLPRFRGPSPIQSAILSGVPHTGVSLYLIDEQIDHGPLIAVSRTEIGGKNYETLLDELGRAAGKLLRETIPKFIERRISLEPQNAVDVTYTQKFKLEDAFVPEEDLNAALNGDAEKAVAISRKIRALNPEPGAWTIRNGKRLKLLGAEIRNSALVLTRTQFEGEKPKDPD